MKASPRWTVHALVGEMEDDDDVGRRRVVDVGRTRFVGEVRKNSRIPR